MADTTTITITDEERWLAILALGNRATYLRSIPGNATDRQWARDTAAASDRLADRLHAEAYRQRRARESERDEAESHRGVRTGRPIVATIGTPVRAGGSTPLADWLKERDR